MIHRLLHPIASFKEWRNRRRAAKIAMMRKFLDDLPIRRIVERAFMDGIIDDGLGPMYDAMMRIQSDTNAKERFYRAELKRLCPEEQGVNRVVAASASLGGIVEAVRKIDGR